MSRQSLSDIYESARSEFLEALEREDYEDLGDVTRFLNQPHDTISEIADGSVPVYHSDLLNIAANDNEVATRTPECGPAFDGEATPVNIIAANIYEMVQEDLFGYARELEEEADELDNEVTDLADLSKAELDAKIAELEKIERKNWKHKILLAAAKVERENKEEETEE